MSRPPTTNLFWQDIIAYRIYLLTKHEKTLSETKKDMVDSYFFGQRSTVNGQHSFYVNLAKSLPKMKYPTTGEMHFGESSRDKNMVLNVSFYLNWI